MVKLTEPDGSYRREPVRAMEVTNMKSQLLIVILMMAVIMLAACSSSDAGDGNKSEDSTYQQISQEEAKKLMDSEMDYVILDVRTKEEYEGGHIAEAVCIPNETIDDTVTEQLPDKDQLILVYCRSGNRSKQASQKLADLGYTDIREFGGINTWQYEIE